MIKRLQVVLSHSGVASRRKAVEIIELGHVLVNGNVVREKGFQVDTEKDKVSINGKPLKFEPKVYYVMNKPRGYITTVSDEQGRKTIFDLVPSMRNRIFPVGRLDKETEGILILTNDGDLTMRLTHPRYGVKKVYIAEIKGKVSGEDVMRLEKGVYIDGKKTARCSITILDRKSDKSTLRIELHEGKKRQIRYMVSRVGCGVARLKRISYGGIELASLPSGKIRMLSQAEIKLLKDNCFLEE